jgi:hypothetical protein
MSALRRAFTAALLAVFPIACGGGGSSPGTEKSTIVPCDQGTPSFDVWRAVFFTNGATRITASVDTVSADSAAEFRLVVACDDKVVLNTIAGAPCSDPPPAHGGGSPECPLGTIDVADLPVGQVECLAEVTSTQPLHIGVGNCADPTHADYELFLRLDVADLALDLVADDCRDTFSCLQRQFGIDVRNP